MNTKAGKRSRLSTSGKSGKGRKRPKTRRWVHTVTTVSTFPPAGTFAKSAQEIADIMASPEVSPKGIGSGIRMIQYFLNRGGRNLPSGRRQQLERAKRILQRRLASRESHEAAQRS